MDADGCNWNTQVIDQNFLPYGKERILQIPIGTNDDQDSILWMATKDGNYTVKSGCHCILNQYSSDQPSGSDRDKMKNMWQIYWKVKVQPKIKTQIFNVILENKTVVAGGGSDRKLGHMVHGEATFGRRRGWGRQLVSEVCSSRM
ncbi:unnamed protein product [Vicia faba]|uniref:Uncharacterized protein n=1 Tax=Vicia faba TaxID=3906 RepID=A0AAV0YHD9_VICFA|nr:unnamed protein product [Vicia faba]